MMAIRKQYLKGRPVCKVTFKIPGALADSTEIAHVAGEFNDWSIASTPMKRLKNGAFSVTIDLATGRSYQFRYLLGHARWINDPDADGDLPSPYADSRNSVIHL